MVSCLPPSIEGISEDVPVVLVLNQRGKIRIAFEFKCQMPPVTRVIKMPWVKGPTRVLKNMTKFYYLKTGKQSSRNTYTFSQTQTFLQLKKKVTVKKENTIAQVTWLRG